MSEQFLTEKLLQVEAVCVLYPRFADLMEQMETCRKESALANEAMSMLIYGQSGAGKTTLINQYLKNFPRKTTSDGSIVPVFFASLPSKVTIKGCAKTLLKALGAPNASHGDEIDMTSRLVTLIKNCGVELIILDEFQHLLQRASAKGAQQASDWLKELMNKTKVPLVLVGMPECTKLLEAHEQLDRRFIVVEELASFNYVRDASEYRKFLKAVQQALPFPQQDGALHLYDPLCAKRIYVASRGSPGRTMRLIREAAKMAVKKDLAILAETHLATTYTKYIARLSKLPKSPWELSENELDKLVIKVAG